MSFIRVGFVVKSKRQSLLRLLNALVDLNRHELRLYRLPPLYKSGVRYKREPKIPGRREDWKTITQILKDKHGDCEDLTAWRVSELREQGIKAMPWLTKHGNTWHVVVRYPDGKIEDPSKRLGMRRI